MPMPMSKSSTRMRNKAMIMTKPPYWRVAETVSANSAGTKKPPAILPPGAKFDGVGKRGTPAAP